MKEKVAKFGKAGSLVGILTTPQPGSRQRDLPGVILINAGRIHRVGPNRVYVKIARMMAGLGMCVLRYDLSGIGDSDVRRENLPFDESRIRDVQEAMAFLGSVSGVRNFVLIGLCAGAATSLSAASADPRVTGAILISPLGFHDTPDYMSSLLSYMDADRYLRTTLFNPKSWMKAFRGRARYRLVASRFKDLVKYGKASTAGAAKTSAIFDSLAKQGTRLLLVYGTIDRGLEYLDMVFKGGVEEVNSIPLRKVEIIQGSDHNFTLLHHQRHLLQVIHDWADSAILREPLRVHVNQ